MNCLGPLTPDPIGDALGTGYQQFKSPSGVHGLCRVDGDRLDLLAVIATHPGTGQFRAFTEQCKARFKTICVWHVMNVLLDETLQAYGFRGYEERTPGEYLSGWRWDR